MRLRSWSEILLGRLHGQDQALLRHLQVFLLEPAGEHVGPFDQGGHLVQQGGILDRLHAADPLRGVGELADDLVAPLVEARHDGAFGLHLGLVTVGVPDRERPAGRLEAVALGLAPGRQTEHRNRHHFGTVERDQGVGRADEVDRAPAIGQLISHHLGNG